MKTLRKSCYVIDSFEFGEETVLSNGQLKLKSLSLDGYDLEIIQPGEDFSLGKVLDILPLTAKRGDDLGEGVTAVIDNGVLLLSQDGEEELLSEKLQRDHSGTFTNLDFILHLSSSKDVESIRKTANEVLDEVRVALREVSEKELIDYSKEQGMTYRRQEGKPKILVVKELKAKSLEENHVLGKYHPTSLENTKNLMEDKKKIRDYDPLEILDGVIINQTNLTDGNVESSRHHFRDPLILEFINTDRVDLLEIWLLPVGDEGELSYTETDFKEELEKIMGKEGLDGVVYHSESFEDSVMTKMGEILDGLKIPWIGVTSGETPSSLQVVVNTNKENEKIAGNNVDFRDSRIALEMILSLVEGNEILPADGRASLDIRNENFQALMSGESLLRSEI